MFYSRVSTHQAKRTVATLLTACVYTTSAGRVVVTVVYVMHKSLVPTAQKTHYVSIIKLFSENSYYILWGL